MEFGIDRHQLQQIIQARREMFDDLIVHIAPKFAGVANGSQLTVEYAVNIILERKKFLQNLQ